MIRFFFFTVLIVIIFSSCQTKQSNPGIQSSGGESKPEILIFRYEKELFGINPTNIEAGLERIYPTYKFFLGESWKDTINLLRIYNYISDPNIRELYNVEMIKYPDVTFLKKGLEGIFDKVIKYYPSKTYPIVYTYVSGLDIEIPVIYADTVMAISMDLFLGKDVNVYTKAGIPEYMISRFTEQNILPECAKAIADSIIIKDINKQSLLDQMIVAGKRLYFADIMLPEVPAFSKIGYSQEKYTWCEQNEGNIWSFMITNQLLFSSDPKITGKLMTDAPFTSGFIDASPGRLGEWVGWKIVKAYVKANPSVSMQDLMKNTDSQSILQGSKYKPGR